MNVIAVNEYIIRFQLGCDPIELTSLLAPDEKKARELFEVQNRLAKIISIEFSGTQQIEMDLFKEVGK